MSKLPESSKTNVDPAIYGKDYYLYSSSGQLEQLQANIAKNAIKPPQKQIDLARLKPGDRVMEIGCGTGKLLSRLATYGCYVTAVDYSQEAIDLAQKVMSALPEDVQRRISFVCQDAKKLQFVDQFDAVISMDFVEHVYDWELKEIFSGIFRALKAGGRLIIFTKPNLNWIRFGYPIKRILGIPGTLYRKWFRKKNSFTSDYDRWEYEKNTWKELKKLKEPLWRMVLRYLEIIFYRDRYNYDLGMHVNEMTPKHLKQLLHQFDTQVWCEEHSKNLFAQATKNWWGPHVWAVAKKP